MFDWRHELSTTDPVVLQVDAVDLPAALRGGPGLQEEGRRSTGARRDKTVLANEQVIAGACERCGTHGRAALPGAVVLPDHRLRRAAARQPRRRRRSTGRTRPRTAQRNWIGRSRGRARSDFAADARRRTRSRVFTTRPDTIFGATYMVLAPEHPLVDALTDAASSARRSTPIASRRGASRTS